MTLLLLSTLAQVFVNEPYLQLGEQPAPDRLSIVWHAPEQEASWWLEHKSGAGPWIPAARVQNRRVRLRNTPAFRIYEAELDQLTPGAEFDYRVSRNAAIVFTARGKAIAAPSASVRFALIGDTGQGTRGQKSTVYQLHRAQPDAMLVTGDIVYPSGRLKHYFSHWFPIFNAAAPALETGGPVLRSRLSAAAPGNHDFEECLHLGAKPDCLAYFHIWSQPLNGPAGTLIPLQGPAADVSAFRALAGSRYPRSANYSFDYGPVHWTVIDSSSFMDWTTPALRSWLEQDLAAARTPWKFVVLHHAPFHSSRKHAEQQRMRVLAGIFEAQGVAIVFSGHVHNYQRTHAIRFIPKPFPHPLGDTERIPGETVRDPKGVIYLLTGAGGAGLHDGRLTDRPNSWKSFTAKLEAREHSFTQLDVSPGRLTLRQIGENGNELDFLELAR